MALVDSAVVFVVSLLVGAIGIYAGVRLVADRDISFVSAVITALLGAIAWAVVSFFVGWLPVLGAVIALLVWIGIINYRYPGGWPTAVGIGVVAWLVSAGVLFLLGMADLVSFEALGVPGA